MSKTRYTDPTLASDPPGGKHHVTAVAPNDALPTEQGLKRARGQSTRTVARKTTERKTAARAKPAARKKTRAPKTARKR